jgi:hypothetical protein
MPEYITEKIKLKHHNHGVPRVRLFPTLWAPCVWEAEVEAAVLWPGQRVVVSRLRPDWHRRVR